MSFIFIYGRPGKGKSTLAASMTNLGYKVLFVDIDQKVDKMINLKKQIDAGMIQTTPIDAKLTETTLRERIKTPQKAFNREPKGYLHFCDIISSLEELIEKGEKHECQVLVIDSLTSLLEHLDREISFLSKKDHFTFDEWDILLTNLEEMFYTLIRLQGLFKHVIVIAHEQAVVDETTGKVQAYLPAIKGSMRNKVGKYFEEIYHIDCEVNKTNGKAEYKVLTKATGKYEARTSRPLDLYMPADFGILFAEEIIRTSRTPIPRPNFPLSPNKEAVNGHN